jgi:uncharacterized membrane protein HdeD (DUF308 family)
MKGIILIVIGALTLAATRLGSLTYNNWVLIIGLLLIIAGIVLSIREIKHDSRY